MAKEERHAKVAQLIYGNFITLLINLTGDEDRELGAESTEDESDIESELFSEEREEKRRF